VPLEQVATAIRQSLVPLETPDEPA
jgi:hypothetical protein